ncbi:MAG: polysulfide reductase NrfD, partial [Phycisphaerae bacterium]|nr:polysulfide reductase NrfD [Phycisphaerae bacterium]
LFEVAWCVMFYQSVLFLELVPAAWERFGRHEVAAIWRKLVPVYTVFGLTLFTYMMTHGMPGDLAWTGAAFVFFGLAAIILPRIVHHAATTPILLVMFGIVLSTCHQSTLGSLFLLMPDKLSHLWWTPLLPVNFILSAIAIGLCMVIVERTLSALAFGRVIEREKLASLARLAGPLLWLYLVVRLVDMAARGNLGLIGSSKGVIFIIELVPALIAGVMLMSGKVRENTGSLMLACILAIGGVVLNRMNVCIWGMTIPGVATYVPTFIEVLISSSIITGIMLVYTLVVKLFPVYTAEHAETRRGVAAPAPA